MITLDVFLRYLKTKHCTFCIISFVSREMEMEMKGGIRNEENTIKTCCGCTLAERNFWGLSRQYQDIHNAI